LAIAHSQAFGQQYPFLPVAGSPKGVANLFQDSRGRIWLGGAQLSCFDGSRFFSLADYGFPPATTYDISEDPSGAIWIGGETGVYRFANGRVEEIAKGIAVSVIAARPDVVIALVGPPERGTPMVSADLIRLRQIHGEWVKETVMALDSGGPLTRDDAGMLLYPRRGAGWAELPLEQVISWHSGATIQVINHSVAGFPMNGKLKVTRDRTGCVWESGPSASVYHCGHDRREAPFEGANTQANLHEAPDGTMVLEGFNILAVGRPGSFRLATPANGLAGPLDTLPARDGTIWLASGNGLFRFASPYRIEYWTAREGLPSAPWSVARSGGRVYAGLEHQIAVLNRDRLRWDILTTFKEHGSVSSLVGEPDGALIAGLMYGGVARVEPDGRVSARTEKSRPRSGMRLARTPRGEVWVGGEYLGRLRRTGSVLKFENHVFHAQKPGGIQTDAVLAVKYQKQNHSLWACFNGGLTVKDDKGAWREITTQDGLLGGTCWSLAPLSNGDVWYAYYQRPAFALVRPAPGGRFTVRQYRAEDGVPDPASDGIDADKRGWLWRSGGLGIYVADEAEAEAGQWLRLDQSDGFPANDMNSGSFFADDDGSLWWGADNDLAHYVPPPDLVRPQFAPQVFVSAFSWDNNPPRLAEAVTALPHGTKVTAHIGSLQFDRRNALRLRYRILPEQPTWRETRTLDLVLGALSSGAHTLEVQGRVFTGPWSGTARRSFTVLRPIGLTWPLLAGYFLVAASLAAGGYLLRRRHQAEEAALLPDLAAWRMGALLPEVHELEGTLLDSRFEVGGLLARGGFANVLNGYDREQTQRCAIKVFRGEVKEKAWIQRRFEQEVAALRKIRHPNVVAIYAHGTAPSGAPYLVMEFVEGRNLREVLAPGPLSPQRTARLLRQLAGALDAIHALGICHRDVKPENVIVRNEGSPEEESVLIDFSIAIVKDANETLHGLSRAAGSFDYMAPEQAVGYAEPSSDIYSLAKLVLEMLTGRQLKDLLPDAALDLPDRVRGLARSLEVGFSDESVEMLATALEFDPARRPRAAGSFAAPLINDLTAASS
jgi:tRNA A-37 threonylcarbamoyl transferase component Bud32